MNFGLQTFTIRKYQKKDMESAYLPLVKMGISDLEIARIDFTKANANKVKSLIDKYGINPVSIQVKPKYVFGDVDGIVEFCKITGCKNVVISMLPFDCILGKEEKFYNFLALLDKQYDIYQSYGITLAYHHHNWEYVTLSNGKTRMAELLSKTQKIKFVHDTYWTARSGVDPVLQIKEFGTRLLGIHLRDLTFKKKFLDVIACDTVVGNGFIDFGRVIQAAEDVDAGYMVIEQKTDTPYDDIKQGYENLLKIRSAINE